MSDAFVDSLVSRAVGVAKLAAASLTSASPAASLLLPPPSPSRSQRLLLLYPLLASTATLTWSLSETLALRPFLPSSRAPPLLASLGLAPHPPKNHARARDEQTSGPAGQTLLAAWFYPSAAVGVACGLAGAWAGFRAMRRTTGDSRWLLGVGAVLSLGRFALLASVRIRVAAACPSPPC